MVFFAHALTGLSAICLARNICFLALRTWNPHCQRGGVSVTGQDMHAPHIMARHNVNTQALVVCVFEREEHGGIHVGDGERQARVYVVPGPHKTPVHFGAGYVERRPKRTQSSFLPGLRNSIDGASARSNAVRISDPNKIGHCRRAILFISFAQYHTLA